MNERIKELLKKPYQELTLDEIAEIIEAAGLIWVETKQLADHKDRFSKVLLAQIKNDIRGQFLNGAKKLTQDQIECMALTQPDWESYLKEWKEAEKKAGEAKIKWEKWNNLFVAKQSDEATKRKNTLI